MIVAECCPLSPDEKHCMIILAARRLLQLPIIPTHCKHSLYSLQAILKLETKNVLLQSKSKVSKLKYVQWQYFNNYSNHKEVFGAVLYTSLPPISCFQQPSASTHQMVAEYTLFPNDQLLPTVLQACMNKTFTTHFIETWHITIDQ